MKYNLRYIIMAVAMLSIATASAQSEISEKFAIKATADIGLGNVMQTKYALPNMSSSSSSSNFGVDFGWTFFQVKNHSLEANLGFGYGSTSLTADMSKLDYHYSAPAAADMDMEPYIRYYELSGLHQKIRANILTLPIYLNYRYQINKIVSLHALVGVKLGFNVSSKVNEAHTSAFSYGIYPQYDNLMIDASYMNDFGESVLGTDQALKPEANGVTTSLLAGLGAEVKIYGPLSADVTLRYEGGINDMFKGVSSKLASFDAENAPVKYTVADGQQMTALSSYLCKSKISRLSIAVSLLYRF